MSYLQRVFSLHVTFVVKTEQLKSNWFFFTKQTFFLKGPKMQFGCFLHVSLLSFLHKLKVEATVGALVGMVVGAVVVRTVVVGATVLGATVVGAADGLADKGLLGLEEETVEGTELALSDGANDKDSDGIRVGLVEGKALEPVEGTALVASDGLADNDLLGLKEGIVEGPELAATVTRLQ
eukprot:CAMPEP_0194346586 /NCGR_PEP_ID=MMETSP0171-20130528/105510_1 /TAXON_ID=218684 /ORGANISM="Corethron pennatum, Strain L29A3" /LENGTH=179 /DNA_ID=CAMNT_0039113729 /DNA_START=43 /DNA_END=582 /DNA_ORIENTATION=+